MGFSPVGGSASATTNASDLTSGTLAPARLPSSLLNHLVAPCRLKYTSQTKIELIPHEGSVIYNPLTGEELDISTPPDATLISQTPGTLYCVFIDTGTGTLGLVTSTTPTLTNGVLHRSSDTGQLLVGAIVPATGPFFADSATQRLVCSLFNPELVSMEVTGADQANLVADDTWKTPSTDMLLSYIKHPFRLVKLEGQTFIFHDSATDETRAGIDVGLTGTPQSEFPGNRPTGSSSHNTQHVPTARSAPTGAFAYEQSRIRLKGSSAGSPDTFDIIKSTANKLWAEVWR